MPKDVIRTSDGAVAIGWARDGQVQIAGYRGDTDEALTAAAHDDSTSWMTLDREGCNRAIRALRRGRDAAYGADA